ncbi:hypothetical protein T03_2699 [Trichinella britovi]|uniref:Uncharacterized protein n=1 Tax=Trichinella britovi TaxID=45882 RepID=A0A0V1DFN6_TRIBR|nr:hypothetical protein T03_2699 [Trichinella britovi]
MLSVRRVVNYISALQNEPRNSDTSDVEDEEVHTSDVEDEGVHCRFATPSPLLQLNTNSSIQLKHADYIVDWMALISITSRFEILLEIQYRSCFILYNTVLITFQKISTFIIHHYNQIHQMLKTKEFIQKLLQFIYHYIIYFLENFNFYYSSCCSVFFIGT